MKLKLDENIGRQGQELLRKAGHDVATVLDQGLSGAPDETVFEECLKEGRALLTLDHDFGQVLRFAPGKTSGIVVLELPPRPTPESLDRRLEEFLKVLDKRSLEGQLWIVEPGRVRVHQSAEGDS